MPLERPLKVAVGFGNTPFRYEDSQAGKQRAALKGLSQAVRKDSPATTNTEEGPGSPMPGWPREEVASTQHAVTKGYQPGTLETLLWVIPARNARQSTDQKWPPKSSLRHVQIGPKGLKRE